MSESPPPPPPRGSGVPPSGPPPSSPPTGPPPAVPPPSDPPPAAPPPPTGPPGPPPAAASTGPLLDIGEWLTDTTRRLVQGFGDFFAVLAVVALVATTISAPLLWIASQDAVLLREGAGVFTGVEGLDSTDATLIGAGLLVVLSAQLLLFAAATVHIDFRRRGEPLAWQQTMRLMFLRGPRVVGVVLQALVIGFVVLTVGGVLGAAGLGVLGVLLTFGLLAIFWVRCVVAATHAALDRPGNSLRASFEWSRGLTWPLLGRHVLLTTIIVGMLLITSFFSAPFQSLGGAEPAASGDVALADLVGGSLPAFLAVQFINALSTGVVSAVWASAMLSILRGEPAER